MHYSIRQSACRIPNEHTIICPRCRKRTCEKDRIARRGGKHRTAALRKALEAARQRFSDQSGISSDAPIVVIPSTPAESPGLPAADYFLWALQRLYERCKDRYVELLWPAFRLVHDLDDTRNARPRGGLLHKEKAAITSGSGRLVGDIGSSVRSLTTTRHEAEFRPLTGPG